MKEAYNIFYSWQSDLPKEKNQNGIRQALRESANLLENEFVDSRFELDEATRNTSGSPNIPATIFKKIELADVFIADITTINSIEQGRKTPNPNVLIELGFAISSVGWDRIILLYNKDFGTFPDDVPFDIDRHRTTLFSIKDKSDKDGKKQLSKVLDGAIKKIIIDSPLKPAEQKNETPEQKKRRVDISNLKWILRSIHTPTFDKFLEEMPGRIYQKIFFYKDGLSATMESSSFHLYDKQLFKLFTNLEKNLGISLSFYKHYDSSNNNNFYNFYLPMDTFPDEDSEKDYKYLLTIRLKLIKNFRILLKYLRENYLEIDLDENDSLANQDYLDFNS